MKFFKNNLKIIIGFTVGVILASSITVYAYNYFASDIKYTDDQSVADALNDLYIKFNNMDNYDNKTYTQEGLIIFQDRVAIISGGYYVDENNVTYVNLKLKTKINLSTNTSWLLIHGLPTSNSSKCITDTEKNLMFRVGDFQDKTGRIDLALDYYANEIPTNTEFILQFKY